MFPQKQTKNLLYPSLAKDSEIDPVQKLNKQVTTAYSTSNITQAVHILGALCSQLHINTTYKEKKENLQTDYVESEVL